jgi:hypothetical protein
MSGIFSDALAPWPMSSAQPSLANWFITIKLLFARRALQRRNGVK